jgi:hypothetical protein
MGVDLSGAPIGHGIALCEGHVRRFSEVERRLADG